MTLTDMLKRHEGWRLKPYIDTVGKMTIGCGRNLDDRGISDDEALLMLSNDVAEAIKNLSVYPWFHRLDGVRRSAMIDMMFMGAGKFAQFKKMHAALDRGDYKDAAAQLLDSAYATQVGQRARDLAYMLEKGDYNVA